MTLLTRALAVVSAAAAAITVVGCADAGSARQSSAAPPSSPAAEPTLSGTMTAAVKDYLFPGDGSQYATGAAAASIMISDQSQLVSRCMSRYGFAVAAMTPAQAAAEDFDNTQFPDLSRIARTHQLNPALTTPLPTDSPVPDSEQAAFRADDATCADQPSPLAALAKAASALVAQWQADVARIQASAQVVAKMQGFTACVELAGTPAGEAGSFDAYLAWVTGQESRQGTPAAARSADARFAAVFVRCARPVVSVEATLQLTRRASFLHDHRPAVAALITLGAEAITAAARQLGTSAG